MNDLKEQVNIESVIYEIKEKQVMLDINLAKLYEYKNRTKIISCKEKYRTFSK